MFFSILQHSLKGQNTEDVSFVYAKKEFQILPGEVVNIPVFIKNETQAPKKYVPNLKLPFGWKLVTEQVNQTIPAKEQLFFLFSVQIPQNTLVGDYPVEIEFKDSESLEQHSEIISVLVEEKENIVLEVVEAPENVVAGNQLSAVFLVKNSGNSEKKLFIETNNCMVSGNQVVTLLPGESQLIHVHSATNELLSFSKKDFYSVRLKAGTRTVQNTFQSFTVFPGKKQKKNNYLLFPITLSTSYLSTNQHGKYEWMYQFELLGSGHIDEEKKHFVEFLARGPNNTNFSFLGLYDQYYFNYKNKNFETFIGEKSYNFTPLTESSRYGMGTENRVLLNNGLSFGFLFVKPRFYEEINSEYAIYSTYEKDRFNSFSAYYVNKTTTFFSEPVHMGSIETKFRIKKMHNFEVEYSRGYGNGKWDHAIRTNFNSSFSWFRLAGNIYHSGKDFPGYFSNTTFYSGTFTVQPLQRLNFGIYAKQDFINAQLDTFFITAPFTNTLQAFVNYNIANRTNIKVYWKDYERKDRLATNKFHYETQSANVQFSQNFKRINYLVLGEYGNTLNYINNSGNQKQRTYRGSANFTYKFNTQNAVKVFASWSNINSFVTNTQRRFTGGVSMHSQVAKNLRMNFSIQNAFDIDDYYKNRNLMQFNLDYKPHKNHTISLRSFYTIFRGQVDNPEFAMAATYTVKLGVPIKSLSKAGTLSGLITNENGEPVEGVVVKVANKSAISNKSGHYTIRGISVGTHLMDVQRDGLSVAEVTSLPFPRSLEIFQNQEARFDFKIVQGAKISGKIELETNAGETINYKGFILEAKDDNKTFRINPNDKGEFEFPITYPGIWKVLVYANTVPKDFQLDKTEISIDLKPGTNEIVSFNLKRKQRKIKFQQQNFNLNLNATSMDPISEKKPAEQGFYAVQIGAFKRKLKHNSNFILYPESTYTMVANGLNKYFIGKFSTQKEASEEKKKLQNIYKNAFIIYIDATTNFEKLEQ